MTAASTASGVRLSALHAATFAGVGFYLPFFPIWLQSKGMGPAMIGFVIAVSIVVRIIVTAPVLALADRTFGLRPLLIAGHAGQVVGYPLLMLVDDPWFITALVAAISAMQAPIIPGNDLATLEAVRGNARLQYGRLRVWGSIAFLATSILAGYLVDAFGPDVVIWALLLTPLAAILATHLTIPARAEAAAASSLTKGKARLPALLLVVIAGAVLIQGSHGSINAFASIHWRAIGFSETVIGYFWAAGVVAEIGVFFLLSQGVGRGSAGIGLIVLGGVAAVLRYTVMSIDPGLAATMAMQALHGFTFGATHLGTLAALAALAPEAARGRAQGLYGSIVALTTAATTLASGPIYRAAGPLVFATMVPLCVAGLVLIAVAARMMKARPLGGNG